jgi:hypothetical protein
MEVAMGKVISMGGGEVPQGHSGEMQVRFMVYEDNTVGVEYDCPDNARFCILSMAVVAMQAEAAKEAGLVLGPEDFAEGE